MPPSFSVTSVTAGSGGVTVTTGSGLIDPETREYYVMRWRVCMTELRFLADRLGWADRLPSKGRQI